MIRRRRERPAILSIARTKYILARERGRINNAAPASWPDNRGPLRRSRKTAPRLAANDGPTTPNREGDKYSRDRAKMANL